MPESTWETCISYLQSELPAQQFNTWIRPLRVESSADNVLRLMAPNRFVLDWVNDKFLERIQELINQQSPNTYFQVELGVAARSAKPNTDCFLADIANLQTDSTSKLMGQSEPQPEKVSGGANFGTPNTSTPLNGLGLDAKNGFESVCSEPTKTEIRNGEHSEYSSGSVFMDGDAVLGSPDINRSAIRNSNIFSENRSFLNNASEIVGNNPAGIFARKEPRVKKSEVEGGLLHKSNLNKNFVFKSFVVGKSNQLGLAAATQVAENPGGSYNPLFIYGGVGLGKTHLMHAVGNELAARKPGAKVVYLHSERFVADMVKALQLNAINDFKRYYRSVDALLIDDIQFFAGKERSQEEFFHTFNALLEGGQQIILTCDRYPKEIDGLEERLKSRFGWGLTVAIEPPELETRVAIIKKKAEESSLSLPNDAAFFIAQRIRSNVRELEGALKRVIANAQFTGRPISVELVRESLKDLLALQDRLVSIDNIQRVVAEYYKIKVSDLHSKRRSRSIARPRQVAMYLAKDLTHHSLPEIGEVFGGRDHTTVLHACRKIKELLESDADIREDVKNLLRTLTT